MFQKGDNACDKQYHTLVFLCSLQVNMYQTDELFLCQEMLHDHILHCGHLDRDQHRSTPEIDDREKNLIRLTSKTFIRLKNDENCVH